LSCGSNRDGRSLVNSYSFVRASLFSLSAISHIIGNALCTKSGCDFMFVSAFEWIE